MNVSYDKISAPPRSNIGKPSRLTPEQESELWSWYLARRALGSFADKAKEFGVAESSLKFIVHNIARRKLAP
jgi:hypothetical protein